MDAQISQNNTSPDGKKYLKLLLAVAFAWLLVIGWLKFDLYRKDILTSDMALYPNILWNTDFKGKLLYSDFLYDWYGYKTFLNEHFAPTLLLLAPIYHLIPHPLTLVFLQTLMPVLTAFIIYALAKKVFGKPVWALACSLSYLLHPALISATIDNVYGFHHDVLIMPLIALTALFFYENRFWPFLISIFLLFGLKENIPIVGLIFGIELLLIKQYRKRGAVVSGLALLFIFSGLWLLPRLTGLENHHAASVFEQLRGLTVTGFFSDLKSFSYWLILLPFLPAVFAPALLLLAAPDWAMYFLSQKLPFYHHVFFSFSILAVAAIFGLKKAIANEQLLIIVRKYKTIIILALLVIYLGGNFMVFRKYIDLERKFSWRKIDKSYLAELDQSVPRESCLDTTSDLAVYFVNRPCLSWSNESLATADYVLINKNAAQGFDYDSNFIEQVYALELQKKISRIGEKEDLIIFKKNY